MTEMGGAEDSKSEGGIVPVLGMEEVGVGVEEVEAGEAEVAAEAVAVEVVEAAKVATAGAVIS